MSGRPDISVVIVNWRSGAMTRALVDNLREQRFTGRNGGQGSLEFIVTDNASGPEEDAHLCALESDPDITVIRSASNGGYALGVNLGVEAARGVDLLITNPDVMAFAGALAALRDHQARHPACGLAGPKGFLDADCFFQLPPTELPGLAALLSESLARAHPFFGRRHAEARTCRAVAAWTSTEPVSMSQISGFCFLMPATLARELGPFDPQYPFYYEDADLCLRLHRRGFSTDLVPRARMVHFFNRSASQAEQAVLSRYDVSRRRFYGRRYGQPGRLVSDALTWFMSHGPGRGHTFAAVDHLGDGRDVRIIDVPGSGAYLAEISADPGFVFAAGRLEVARPFRVPAAVWGGLVETRYYVRFLSRRNWRVLRVVSMDKTSPPEPVVTEGAGMRPVHA